MDAITKLMAKEDTPLTCRQKFKRWMTSYWRGIIIIAVPLLALPIVVPPPTEYFDLLCNLGGFLWLQKYHWVAYCLILMAVFWVTECLPLPVTSFLPIFIFPLAGVMSTNDTCVCYFNSTIIMFFGSLVLASAVEQSGLHKRLAYCAIRVIGYSHYKLLFAMCFVTMFVSMWLSNTAATTMMVPIIFAVLEVFEEQKLINIYEKNSVGELEASDMTTCYFCAATYSATIGGIGTLVGTGTNLVFKGLMETTYPNAPEYLSFPLFSAFAVPYMLVLEALCYLCLIFVYFGLFRPKSKAAKQTFITPRGVDAAKAAVERESAKLGSFTYWQLMVTILFGGAMVMFFARSPKIFTGWADLIVQHLEIKDGAFIRDSCLAMAVAFAMLLLPKNFHIIKNFTAKYREQLPKRIPAVLDWRKMDAGLPYSFMFLLGGGFALSTAANKNNSDLNGRIGDALMALSGLPDMLIIFILIAFTIFITNFASNVAVANVVVPIAMTLAQKLGKNPLQYNIACGYSASYCFMLPVGTPGNLVVQSAAKIPIKKMMLAGFGPTITTTLITWIAICFWAPVVWPELREQGAPIWSINSTQGP